MKHAIRTAVTVVLLTSALSAATLTLVPSSVSLTPGETFTVDVGVSDVVDLYAYQLDVGVDPGLLEVLSVTAGPFLGTGGSTVFLEGTIDNSAGTVSAIAESLMSLTPGVSGSGTLLQLSLRAKSSGNATVSAFNPLLLDSALFGIATSDAGTTVAISGVPEPSTAILIGAVLFVFGGGFRKSRQ